MVILSVSQIVGHSPFLSLLHDHLPASKSLFYFLVLSFRFRQTDRLNKNVDLVIFRVYLPYTMCENIISFNIKDTSLYGTGSVFYIVVANPYFPKPD